MSRKAGRVTRAGSVNSAPYHAQWLALHGAKMASILSAGTTEAASSTFTLAAGESKTVYLTSAAGPGIASDIAADIQIASAGGEYFTLGTLTRAVPSYVVQAVGTFRVLRRKCSSAVGIEAN